MLENSKNSKNFLPKENTQNVSLTGENLTKELLDEISTGNVEKLVRILLTDKFPI